MIKIEPLGQSCEYIPPPGWNVINVINVVKDYGGSSGSYVEFYAVLERHEYMYNQIEEVKKEYTRLLGEATEQVKKKFDADLANKIGDLKLLEGFDKMVRTFPTGGTAYWYKFNDYLYSDQIEDINNHINKSEVAGINYTPERVVMGHPGDGYTILEKGYASGSVTIRFNPFNSLEACIAANQDAHRANCDRILEGKRAKEAAEKQKKIDDAKKLLEEINTQKQKD